MFDVLGLCVLIWVVFLDYPIYETLVGKEDPKGQ